MKKIIGTRTVKTGIGATIAMLIAESMQLRYFASAGIITILSIQSTKKQSIQMAMNRFRATMIALVISTILFTLFGFHISIFGIYLMIFIPIAARLQIQEGIVPASVLVTHLLGEGYVDGALLINELLLLVIGVIVALLLNLYMPSVEEDLHALRNQVEEQLYQLFMNMTKALLENSDEIGDGYLIKGIKETLEQGKSVAYKQSNNFLFAHVTVYERYFDMRLGQFQVLCAMQKHFRRFFVTYQETQEVAEFTKRVAESVYGIKTSHELLGELDVLRNDFRESHLPTSREEFENRAMLYQFLNDLEHFLEIKQQFRMTLSDEEMVEYQKGYNKA